VEQWTTIRYLQTQGKSVRAIARELGLARNTVRQALRGEERPKYQRPRRVNAQLEPFAPQIREWLFRHQFIGSRIIRELRALGYRGGHSAVYAYLQELKAALPKGKVTERFETEPGQQGQFDWSPYTVELHGELRRVIVFCLTLGFSRRKHYAASLDERQASIFEAIEECFWHFGGVPKEMLVDNPRAFVLNPHPTQFRWNPQFLELMGHYRVKPRACKVGRAQTKGKVEKPFFYLEQHFIKGRTWTSFSQFLADLAAFERDELDVMVHHTTQERPVDRFERELPHLVPLPDQRFVGSLALVRKVSWDCLISYQGSRYSVPAAYAAKMVWLLPSRGANLVILSSKREVIAEHQLSPTKGATILNRDHYASLRRGTPRTYALLAQDFLARFPHHGDFLEGLTAQHKLNPADHLRAILDLAGLYEPASLERVFHLAREYNTYSHAFVRGLLESGAVLQSVVPEGKGSSAPTLASPIRADLAVYQRLLEA
jgi:transposase